MQPANASISFYIVGAGSFARKLSRVLDSFGVTFTYVDEIAGPMLEGVCVINAEQAGKHNNSASKQNPIRFLIAISIPEFSQNAIKRLVSHGIKASQCLSLQYDSDCRMLEHMLRINMPKTLNLLQQSIPAFDAFETAFFEHKQRILKQRNKPNKPMVAFCCVGRGGGYLEHLGQLPQKVDERFNSILLSDSVQTSLSDPSSAILMGQSAMLNQSQFDLVITANVFPCSAPATKKLSLSHMVYDFLLYDQQTHEHLSQAETHYIFVPSAANMKMHQDICINQGLSNNIVLIPGGYPRHDRNLQRYKQHHQDTPIDSILYAPTLSSLPAGNETTECFSIIQALEFIPAILAAFTDKQLIFRPHPEDLALVEYALEHPRAKAFASLLAWCEGHPRCTVDADKHHYLNSFARSAAIITDTSSVGFSFGLITGRPALYFSSDHDTLLDDFCSSDFIRDRDKFGVLVNSEHQLLTNLQQVFAGNTETMTNQTFCQDVVYNSQCSEDYLMQNIAYILDDKPHPDWWYLKDALKSINKDAHAIQ